jgi:23S rRNA (guanosine2251-2'-O)-methyltransferase
MREERIGPKECFKDLRDFQESFATVSTPVAVAGIHSVRAALKHGSEGIVEIWLERKRRDRRLAQLAELARESQVAVRQVARDELDGAADGANHQGVVAWVRITAARSERDLARILQDVRGPPFLLILDGVQDPHNLGACLRVADAAGAHALIAPRDNAVGLTSVACKVASGAALTLPFVQVTNLSRTIEGLKGQGIWLIGADGEAPASLFEMDLTGPLALVMGGEGKGLRRLTRERCDSIGHLPMLGTVESLNVSVAAGICLYEAVRQRLR